MWDNRQYFSSAMFQHIMDTLSGKEFIGMGGLTQTVKEEWQVVVVVQLLYLNLGGEKVCPKRALVI